MNFFRAAKPLLLALSIAALIASCKAPTSDSGAPANADTAKPAAPADPNAINKPIAADAYKVTLSLSGTPALAADGKSATYQLQVKNEGTSPVYGAGTMSVNIGGMALGTDGTMQGPGAVRDFMRAPLPLVAPGQTAVVSVNVPADARLNGRTLRFATVQESVAWHDDKGTVDVGPFKVDGDHFASAPGAAPAK